MDIKPAITHVINGHDFTAEQMTAVMHTLMTGGATPAQIAALLVALRLKGETTSEITAAAQVMRALAVPVELGDLPHTVDIVGTGGDASGTFNISSASMFVAAAAGCHVAKHGNRSVSSRSGSADLLELAGVRLDLTPAQIAQCIRQIGVGFMFAPRHHPAMQYASGPRREIGIRTLFNLLGPLTNPAGVPNQVVGVFAARWLMPLAETLQRLGAQQVLVVHARDGLDEISINERTAVAELRAGQITCYDIGPEDFGLTRAPLDAIRVTGPEASWLMVQSALANTPGAARDSLILNAGAAIYAAGRAATLAEGMRAAAAQLASGAAQQRCTDFIALTQQFT